MVKMAKDDKKKAKESDAFYEKSSPGLLSEQPSEAEEQRVSAKKIADWGRLRGHLESNLAGLRSWRQSWWALTYSQLAEFLEPRRSIWMTQSSGGYPTSNSMTRGRQLNQNIVDPTGTYAVRVLSAGLMSGLASPSRPWFKIAPMMKNVPLDAAAHAWMDETEDRIYTVLAGGNFYNSFSTECTDLVVYGTSPVIIYEDAVDVYRCYNPCVGEYFLANSATNRVDTLYRNFVMTIKQIVDFFGLENCPPEVQKMWQQKGSALNTERSIAHAIEPNFEIGEDDLGKIPGNFAWREVYWVYGANSEYPLSMRGFVDQPFSASRWSQQSNDAYGRSVGMDVIADVIQLQSETNQKAMGIEKNVNPPLLASMELKNQPSSSIPGGVTYVSNLGPGAGMRSIYTVNPDMTGMERDIAAIQARIKLGFFNDIILQLTSNPVTNRTAYETAALLQEKLQVIGPVIENIINEGLKPKLKRIYKIMQRRGLISPMPDSMKAAGGVDVEFISMLALAQKAAATGGLERLAAFVGNLVAVYPEAKDCLDIDKLVDSMNDRLDNPQEILRSDKDRQIRRAAAAKQAQAAQKLAAAQHMATTVNTGAQAAQTLASTQIGGGASALDQLLGGGVGGKGLH